MPTTTITPDPSTLAVESTKANINYPYEGATLPPDQLELAVQAVAQLKASLPSLPDLTPLERQRISKLGIRSRGFVDAALEAVKTDSGLLPQSIALSDFVAQDNLLRGLSLVQTQVAALKAGLDDAVLLVGNHVFSVSRTVYALMKTDAAKAKMQSQKALMRQRFTAKKTSQPATDSAIRQ